MNKVSGYQNEVPVIKSVRFATDNFYVHLQDGRTLIIPLSRFPEIKKLSPVQRRKHKLLAGMGLMFDDLDTVYHVSDFLGKTEPISSFSAGEPSYSKKSNKQVRPAVAEPKAKYRKN